MHHFDSLWNSQAFPYTSKFTLQWISSKNLERVACHLTDTEYSTGRDVFSQSFNFPADVVIRLKASNYISHALPIFLRMKCLLLTNTHWNVAKSLVSLPVSQLKLQIYTVIKCSQTICIFIWQDLFLLNSALIKWINLCYKRKYLFCNQISPILTENHSWVFK